MSKGSIRKACSYITERRLPLLQQWLESYNNINDIDYCGDYRTYSLLQTATVCMWPEVVRLLLEKGIQVNPEPTTSSYFLPLAIVGRELRRRNQSSPDMMMGEIQDEYDSQVICNQIAGDLIRYGCNPDVISENCVANEIDRDSHYYFGTPLWCACVCNDYDLVYMLLEKAHANPNLYFEKTPFRLSETPIDWCLRHQPITDPRIIEILKHHGARHSTSEDHHKNYQSLLMFASGLDPQLENESPVCLIDRYVMELIIRLYVESQQTVDGHFERVRCLYGTGQPSSR